MTWLLLFLSCKTTPCFQRDILGDGIDQDCDGVDGTDADQDGQVSVILGGVDCDDTDASVFASLYFVDRDGDGFGDVGQEFWFCAPKDGFVTNADDCADLKSNVYPDAPEICDSVDNDCDDLVDVADQDLDILTTIRMYQDDDGDGFGALDQPVFACEATSDVSLSNTDCDDTNSQVYPSQGCGECFWGACDLQVAVSPAITIDLVDVPAGSFVLGSPMSETAHEQEEQEILVTLSNALYVMTTPFTQGMYLELMGENPAMFGPTAGYVSADQQCGLDCPIENISWHQVAQVANLLTETWNQSETEQLSTCYQCVADECTVILEPTECTGFRLPTEAEWELAAKAGGQAPYWTEQGRGDLPEEYIALEGCQRDWTLEDGSHLSDYAWFCGNNIGAFGDPLYGTKPVALKQPNGFGLFDMVGGIWEMTTDAYQENRTQNLDPYYAPETNVVRKGGMWGDPPSDLRASRRESAGLNYKNGDLGFRLVRTK